MAEENKETTNNQNKYEHVYTGRRLVWGALIALLAFIVLSGTFMLGRSSGNRGLNRFGTPMMAGRTMMGEWGGFGARGTTAPHGGLLGSVTAINGNNLTVHNSQQDVTVTISSTTSIYKAGDIAKQSDIKTGDVVSVRGTSDSSGNLQATVIDIR